jgi:predicted fused transcriptional regulator/phosphomethylpyrimidine kinase
MYINLRYQNQLLSLTTGISYNVFSIDKTLENQWDKMVMKFLSQNEIAYEDI